MPSNIMQREKDIERQCVQHAETNGWLTVKLDKSARSWPDREFIGPGKQNFYVEFKRPGEKPRAQQTRRIDSLTDLGHDVYVLDCFDDFLSVFSHYL